MKKLFTLVLLAFCAVQTWAQPVITQNPALFALACTNGTGSTSIVATGNNLSYQWTQWGTPLAENQPIPPYNYYFTGVNSSTLTINNMPEILLYGFSCIVSNPDGTATSAVGHFEPRPNGVNGLLTVGDPGENHILHNQAQTTICNGTTLLMSTQTPQYAGTTYQWSNGATSENIVATPNANGSYTATVTFLPGCVNTYSTSVTVHNCTSPEIIYMGGTESQCPGGDIFNAAVFSVWANGGGGNYSYQWQFDGVDIPGATDYFYSIVGSTEANEGNYRCVVSNPNGTATTGDHYFDVVDSLRILSHNLTQDVTICGFDSIFLSMTYSGEPAPNFSELTFSWSGNGGSVGGSNQPSSMAYVNADFYFMAAPHIYGGCNVPLSLDSIFFEAMSSVQPPLVWDNNGTLEVWGGTYDALQWYYDGNPIPGATGNTYMPTAGGDYSVGAIRYGHNIPLNSCELQSAPFNVNINGLNAPDANTGFLLYPNPSSGLVVLQALELGAEVRVSNLAGQIMRRFEAVAQTETIDLTALPAGTYQVQVTQGQATSVKRVVKY